MLICKRDFYYPSGHICLECRPRMDVCYATYIYFSMVPVDIRKGRKGKDCLYNCQELCCHLPPDQLPLGPLLGRGMKEWGTYEKKIVYTWAKAYKCAGFRLFEV